jgi:nitrite reductase/ring-hydroxylating ferredoxin subunit
VSEVPVLIMSSNITRMSAPSPRRGARHIPAEGEDGLFTQSWFPICQSGDVPAGSLRGFDFLDGRVIVVRSPEGQARVHSAFCPHLGADLACGELVGNDVRCAFHHWRYAASGQCTATGIGDPPPPAARLFTFPVQERWGLVWAFNGEKPLYELPSFPLPDEQLVFRTGPVPEVQVDPWVICANTPDWQHIRALHGIRIDSEDPDKVVRWDTHSFLYDFNGRFWNDEPIAWKVGIFGTSLFYQHGTFNGRWLGVLAPLGMPRPGVTRGYFVIAAERGDGSPEALAAAEEHVEFGLKLERSILAQDMNVLQRISYRQGLLTSADKLLSQFLEFVRRYPRAHPAADLMR